MKRLVLCFPVFLLLAHPSVANAAPRAGSNLKSMARVFGFPFVHPGATIEGIIYGGLKIVGSAGDVVERGAAAVHAGVSKVDETVDKIEDVVLPPAPAPAVSPAVPQSQTLAIPGSTARAFVPKGCYGQSLENLAEVRCPGQTITFRA